MNPSPKPLTMSAGYRAMAHGIRELHRLLAEGKDDSPEAEAVRDATDGPWQTLSEVERDRVRGLSEDLYSLVEAPTTPLPATAEAQAALNDAFEARQRGDWDRALSRIRSCATYFAPDLVSFFRGRTWLDAGDAETAALFLEHASRLRPDNGDYLAVFLYVLEKVNPAAAQVRAEQILQDAEGVSPPVVVRAADILFHVSRSLPATEQRLKLQSITDILDRSLPRVEAAVDAGADRRVFTIAVVLQAFCQELLGDTQAAVTSLTKGLRVDPDDPSLLGTRGLLQYGTNAQAVADLELAVRHGGTEPWPYYFLCHHYLATGQFDQCRKLCERLLAMNGSAVVKSEASEWLAIAQAELGFPRQMVRSSFESAVRYDPSNERARRNLAAFEGANKPDTGKKWDTRSAGIVRTSGLTERRVAVVA
jgi:tetratricopeptide (TPR) repeat protein